MAAVCCFCRFSRWSLPKSQDVRAQVCVHWCTVRCVFTGVRSGVCSLVYGQVRVHWCTVRCVFTGVRSGACSLVYGQVCVHWCRRIDGEVIGMDCGWMRGWFAVFAVSSDPEVWLS